MSFVRAGALHYMTCDYDRWRRDSEAVISMGERVLADPGCRPALRKTAARKFEITASLDEMKVMHQHDDRSLAAQRKREQERNLEQAREGTGEGQSQKRTEADDLPDRERVQRRDRSRGRGMSL